MQLRAINNFLPGACFIYRNKIALDYSQIIHAAPVTSADRSNKFLLIPQHLLSFQQEVNILYELAFHQNL